MFNSKMSGGPQATVKDGEVYIKLDSKNPAEHLILDKDDNFVANVSKLPKDIKVALGPTAEEILSFNESSITQVREKERNFLDKDRELAEAKEEIAAINRTLELVIKDLADSRAIVAEREEQFANVFERHTNLEVEFRNAADNQREDLANQLAELRVERQKLEGERDSAIKHKNTAQREVASLRRRLGERESELENLRGNEPERNSELEEVRSNIQRREAQNEQIRGHMRLKDRIKEIFKKHGVTIFSVLTAVGVVIGVIVSKLKNGLTNSGKGLGNGLKDIGKKLGQILPGMVGAVAKFLFKTAADVFMFLAKHAWLLIVAVFIFVVEQIKNKFLSKNPCQSKKPKNNQCPLKRKRR